MKSNFIKRIFSGALYIALIVSAILLLDNSPVMYLLVIVPVVACCIYYRVVLDGKYRPWSGSDETGG